MIGGIAPRPIGFCSSLDENGVANLAPFSYFQAAGHQPPIVFLSFTVTCVARMLQAGLQIILAQQLTTFCGRFMCLQTTKGYVRKHQAHQGVYGQHHL